MPFGAPSEVAEQVGRRLLEGRPNTRMLQQGRVSWESEQGPHIRRDLLDQGVGAEGLCGSDDIHAGMKPDSLCPGELPASERKPARVDAIDRPCSIQAARTMGRGRTYLRRCTDFIPHPGRLRR